MTITEAIQKAKEIGGRDGLNCIAELYETADREPAITGQMPADSDETQPLAGVPILVKDNIDVKGFHTTAGSLALKDNLAKEDAPVIRNLKRNGAVIIGKTNMTEFANYVSTKMPGGYSSRGGQVIHAVLDIKNPATLSCSGEKFNYYEKTFFLFTSLFYMHGQQGYRFHKML